MADGVSKSGFLVLFLSEGVLTRPFVLFELATAVRLNKPIRFVHCPQTDVESTERFGSAPPATQLAKTFAVDGENQAMLSMSGLLWDERELGQLGRQLAKLLSFDDARYALARLRKAERWSDLSAGGPLPSAAPEWSMPSAEEERQDAAAGATSAMDDVFPATLYSEVLASPRRGGR